MKIAFLFLSFLFAKIILAQTISRLGCIERSFRENSFVCVCNSTYCDTIEQVDQEQKETQFQEYVTSRNRYRLDKFKHDFKV